MQLFIKNQYKVIHNEFTYLLLLVLIILSIQMFTNIFCTCVHMYRRKDENLQIVLQMKPPPILV